MTVSTTIKSIQDIMRKDAGVAETRLKLRIELMEALERDAGAARGSE